MLLDRSGLKTCKVSELSSKMQDTDLVMLYRSGALKKATWGQRSSFQDSDLFTVGRGTGIFKTTWGAINSGFMAITKTINGGEDVTLLDVFTQAELDSDRNKALIVNGTVGSLNCSTPSLDLRGTVNATLTVTINGSIQGCGGTPNGGAGGNAIAIDGTNKSIVNNGSIYGGGGAGGQGGTGGRGATSTSSPVGVGVCQAQSCRTSCYAYSSIQAGPSALSDVKCCSQAYTGCWQSTNICTQCCWNNLADDNSNCYCMNCYKNGTTYTNGGTGGDGGFGQGYGQSRSLGAPGANNGGNSGAGGTGGAGGDWGVAGSDGQTGANGNNTNGTAGTNGGAAGFSIFKASGSYTYSGSGERKGQLN